MPMSTLCSKNISIDTWVILVARNFVFYDYGSSHLSTNLFLQASIDNRDII